MTSLNKNSSNGMLATLPTRSVAATYEDSDRDVRNCGEVMTTSWEVLLSEMATPQKQLVVFAHQQGLLQDYLQPWIQRPVPKSPEHNGSHSLGIVRRLLSESSPSESPFTISPDDWKQLFQTEDDRSVRYALKCPDLFLLGHANQPERKHDGAVRLIQEALANGERVLFVSKEVAFLDSVLEEVTQREEVFAFRCLASREKLQDLPTPIRRLTFPERSRILQERALNSASLALEETKQFMNALQAAEANWPRILILSDRTKDLRKQLTQFQEQLSGTEQLIKEKKEAIVAGTEDSPRLQAVPFSQEFLQTVATVNKTRISQAKDCDKKIKELKSSETVQTEKLQTVLADLDPLRPQYEARKNKRWWSPAWWKSAPENLVTTCETLEQQETEIRSELQTIQKALQDKELEKQQSQNECEERWQKAVQEETRTLRATLEKDIQAAEQKRESVIKEWEGLIAQLPEGDMRPKNPLDDNIRECFDRWQDTFASQKEKSQSLTEWVNYLKKSGGELAARLPKLANLVGGLPVAVLRDKRFGESSRNQHFDLLVLDADTSPSEADFQRLAARANRWILLGNSSTTMNASGLFRRFWQSLFCGHERMHKRWVREDSGICCQLVQVPDGARGELECETVADRPEVELRIFDAPNTGPEIAEVKFPEEMSLEECKSFLFTELEEVAIHGQQNCCWVEEEQRILLSFSGPNIPSEASTIELTRGVRERFVPQSDPNQLSLTLAIEFDRSEDWTLEKAVDWVDQYCRAKFLGRTAFLT